MLVTQEEGAWERGPLQEYLNLVRRWWQEEISAPQPEPHVAPLHLLALGCAAGEGAEENGRAELEGLRRGPRRGTEYVLSSICNVLNCTVLYRLYCIAVCYTALRRLGGCRRGWPC